ncbi:MAG TPA: DinB family protein [Rhizomicrobium sp.]|jgi:hypothetical protein
MNTGLRDVLDRQFEIAWKLADLHLAGLSTEECLWRPTRAGLHVHRTRDDSWRADWPERESYDIGAPSIAWLTWHIGFWWSMVLDRSFGDGRLEPENIPWPGEAASAIAWIAGLQERWRSALAGLSETDLASKERTRWPIVDRPYADVVAWVNLELMKNAAEIGYGRFLYASRNL